MPSTKKAATKPAKARTNLDDPDLSGKFTDFEIEAMKARAAELKAAKRRGKADAEADVLAKIAEMPEADRVMAEGIHAIIKATAPELSPRTWYGMPAYAKDGKIICFFTAADKFKSRFATFGFNEDAHLDEGTMWPTGWALLELNEANKAKITELVKRAVS
jgi:uncharacterized protein YdhG (YjbR/CyaY superfamily)